MALDLVSIWQDRLRQQTGLLILLPLIAVTGCSVLDTGVAWLDPQTRVAELDSTFRSQSQASVLEEVEAEYPQDVVPARKLTFDELLNSSRQTDGGRPDAQAGGSQAGFGHVNGPKSSTGQAAGNGIRQTRFGGHESLGMAGAGELAVQPRSTDEVMSEMATEPGLRLNVDEIRQMMNRQSSNDMSEGRILPGQSPQLRAKVKTVAVTKTVAESGRPVPGEGAETSGAVDASPEGIPVQTVAGEFSEAESNNPLPPADVEVEPSMLDRLKGLYDPVEENSRQLFRRPFQRIPSPWNLLRERESSEAGTESAAPVESVPVQTAEVLTGLDEALDAVLVELIQRLEQQLKAWPRGIDGEVERLEEYQRREMDLRLLYLIADQPAAAMAAIDKLPTAQQEFWQELMLGVSQFRIQDAGQSMDQRHAGTVSQIRSAVRHLQQVSTLVLRRMEFCSRINSFGSVEEFPTNDFDPGQPVLLYVEVDNFGSEITVDGGYRTSFSAVLEFYHDDSDEPTESIVLKNIEDSSSSMRSDYFHSFELTIPSHFATGRYRLQLRLRDQISQRETDGVVEFQVR